MYKVGLKIEGCAILRGRPINTVKFVFGQDMDEKVFYPQWRNKSFVNRSSIIRFCEFMEKFPEDEYALRIENDRLDVYTNNQDLYDTLSTTCEENIIHRFQPDINNLHILNRPQHTIIVKKLPKNRYNYRVYLLPHKMPSHSEDKKKYINWIKAQDPRITWTPAIEKWFINTDWNWDRRYVLIEDSQTLLMLKLRNPEAIGRVYDYVISDK
jgi:hypothetical protein